MRPLPITYSSWPINWRRQKEQIATLAVFYDEIWLPHPYAIDPDTRPFWAGDPWASVAQRRTFEMFRKWREERAPLFDAGILRFMPPLPDSIVASDGFLPAFQRRLVSFNPHFADNVDTEVITDLWSNITGAAAMAAHAMYAEKPAPELFVSSSDTDTSRLAGLLAAVWFDYRLPLLNELPAEQILEVREYLRDTREGFRGLLFELTDDLEKRLEEGSGDEIADARKLVERKLDPQYEEFRRQLSARSQGFWSEVLSRVGKFLQVDASPWTPKFYGALLELFLGSFSKAADADRDDLSNRMQAHQYMATLETRAALPALEPHDSAQRVASSIARPLEIEAAHHDEEEDKICRARDGAGPAAVLPARTEPVVPVGHSTTLETRAAGLLVARSSDRSSGV